MTQFQPIPEQPAPPMPKRGGGGKTVVIVLSIVGVVMVVVCAGLFLVLMPALGKARQMARQTVAMSNARQLGIFAMSYAADYKDSLPARDSWPGVLTEYLGAGSGTALDSPRIDGPGPDFLYSVPPGRGGRLFRVSDIRYPNSFVMFYEDPAKLPAGEKDVVVVLGDTSVRMMTREELAAALAKQAAEYAGPPKAEGGGLSGG